MEMRVLSPAVRVFLVEDSPAVLERLSEMLGSIPGVAITGCATGADEAVRAILATRPDMVVLDVRLAQGSGLDVLRAVHSRAPEVECYLLSNFSDDYYRRAALDFGARGFFDKTAEFGRVRDLVAARARVASATAN
jgi:DNA-binding NarL/FixJ family response regulator